MRRESTQRPSSLPRIPALDAAAWRVNGGGQGGKVCGGERAARVGTETHPHGL